MAILFLDTSALVRRYDTTEPGARRVRALCHRAAGHALLVSELTSVETASAFTRKVRDGRWSAPQRNHFWRLFRAHLRTRYRAVPSEELTYRRAERLLFAHPLRAYDALQLAAALQGRRLLTDIAADFRFCTADRVQAAAAAAERLAVEFIS